MKKLSKKEKDLFMKMYASRYPYKATTIKTLSKLFVWLVTIGLVIVFVAMVKWSWITLFM